MGCRWWQWVTRAYRVFKKVKGVTRGYSGVQRVTGGYKRLQNVT